MLQVEVKLARRSVVVLVSATILSACGGDARLTKQQLIQQADAICRASQSTTDDLLGGLPETTTAETMPAIADVFEKVVPVLRETSRRLSALRPPRSDEAVVDEWLDDFDRSVDLLNELRDTAASGDIDAFNAVLDQGTAVGNKADAEATAYGFTVCGAAQAA
jgi:hypothetical protein